MPRVSIKDIARSADVSHSTVSRALSDSPLVSAETKERIQRLARQMGYSPDAQARSLVMGRTLTVGVVVTTIIDPFVAELVQGIERYARDGNYSVILASSDAEPDREIAAVEMLNSKRVDGVIVTSSRVGALYQEHLDRLHVPVVLVNSRRAQAGRYTFSINVDNRDGGVQAVRHLLDLGHRRIAYITGPADHSDDLERLAGYRHALEEADSAFDPSLVVPGDGRAAGGEAALPAIMGREDPITAAFCYNDMTALGLMHAALRAGYTVPGDLAIVGFDDIILASHVHPRLTTIAQPVRRMGRRAMKMVLKLMDNDDPNGSNVTDVVLKGELVVRGSTVFS
jgi:DNA-binding LacI/PurR family transcriptional regulator